MGIIGPSLATYEENGVGTGYGEYDIHAELTIENFDNYYGSVIEDFELNSLVQNNGNKFIYATPSINNPVTITTGNTTGSSVINVENTDGFPDLGSIYISEGNSSTEYLIVSYTGKTQTTFTGCTYISGNTTDAGSFKYVMPHHS